MYTLEQLIEKLDEDNRSLDQEIVSGYLKNWKIDPVYEDEKNIEYFDDLAILKLNQGIELKNQGKNEEEILATTNNEIYSAINAPAIRQTEIQSSDGFKKVTIDITTQTLSLLAESIAQKISDNITDKVKDADIFKPVMNSGKLTRDNEILAQQVEKLVDENKKLISRVSFLQQENAKFKHFVANMYFKQD